MPNNTTTSVVIDVSTTKWPLAVCIIDAEDLSVVVDGGPRWYAAKAPKVDGLLYAVRNIKIGNAYKHQSMHALLSGAKSPFVTDHVNRNGLDNRRANLRICSRSHNSANSAINKRSTSGFKGVTFQNGAWCARVRAQHGTVKIFKGGFSTSREAAAAYDEAARKMFGDFALTNAKLNLLD